MPNIHTGADATPSLSHAAPSAAGPADQVHATQDGPRSILVTGGAGFIGSHLCEALVGQGHKVVCLDNFTTGRAANVQSLVSSSAFRLVTHDVTHKLPTDLPRFDEIYNLACPASPRHLQGNRIRTALICAQGAMSMLDRAQLDGARLLQASTSEVYGEQETSPQRQGFGAATSSAGPRSSYDEGKRFAEALCGDFARENDITVKVARIFNTYGPRMLADDGNIVSTFVVQALSGQDITLHGDDSPTRTFCFVSDMIEGLLRLMRSDAEGNAPVNIGKGAQSSIAQLAQSIVAMTGSRSRIIRLPLQTDAESSRRPHIARATDLLDWVPQVSLPAGLARTIEYFVNELKQRSPKQEAA